MLLDTTNNWIKIKPFFQIELDHDYINEMDIEFKRLEAYIETKEKADSLASVYEIIEFWDSLGKK